MKMKMNTGLLLMASSALLLSACGDDDNNHGNAQKPEADKSSYQASVYRTEGGIAHIEANDFASLGYGTGFAAAEDNVCFLAENFLKFQAQQARYLGAGENNAHINDDLFYQYLSDTGQYDATIDAEFEAMFEGYAAGYNRYLRDTGNANLPARCANKEWVMPVDAATIKRIHLTPFFLPNFKGMVMAAKPPVLVTKASKAKQTRNAQADQYAIQNAIASITLPPLDDLIGNPMDKGSNGVAIGRDLANGANAILFANPHLTWDESQRFWPMHQVMPGVMNLLGANAIDRASVGFGTNGDVAWTNTVSKSMRFSFYQLGLIPGSPTTYVYDGVPIEMTQTTVTIQSLDESGALEDVSHTFYATEFGLLVGNPFPWMDGMAIALRIADEGARGMQGGTKGNYMAKTVHDLKAINDKLQFLPVNLIAADNNGDVLYADIGPVANISNEQMQNCWAQVPNTFNGMDPACQWNIAEDAAEAGLLGASNQPHLYRTDYVTNSNDSYWLANPNAPITGYPEVAGEINTERTLRTRSGLDMIAQRIAKSDGQQGEGFTADQLLQTLMSNQHYAGQMLRDDVVTLCKANTPVMLDTTPVDLTAACIALENWDVTANSDSTASHLFREFLREAHEANGGNDLSRTLPTSFNYTVAFDAANPLTTPRGLDTANNPEVLTALAKAVQKLNADGIALDARLGDVQAITRNNQRMELQGGAEMEGVFNKMGFAYNGSEGYNALTGSSASWIMNTALTDNGPEVKALLAYGVTVNPDSPNFNEHTQRLANNDFITIPYHMDEVKAQALSTINLSEGTEDCKDEGYKQFTAANFNDQASCEQHYQQLKEKQLSEFIKPQA